LARQKNTIGFIASISRFITSISRRDISNSKRAFAPRGAARPRICHLIAPQKMEGVGNAGCPMHPQPRVQKKSTRVEAAGSPESPGIPAREWF
jgi:hypothetical protein